MQLSYTPVTRACLASIANAAGATKTGGTVNLNDIHQAEALATVTNGATGPTIGCSATLQISQDGTNWIDVEKKTAGTGNDEVSLLRFSVPPCLKARVNFAGNTGQDVTVEANILAYLRW